MKALTLRSPWAMLITHANKQIENRTRRTHYRGPILIHSGTRTDPKWLERPSGCSPSLLLLATAPKYRSHITGTAHLSGCHKAGPNCQPACEYWGMPDLWHWELTRVKPLPLDQLIPWRKGQLGLWTPPTDLLAQVERTLRDTYGKGLPT